MPTASIKRVKIEAEGKALLLRVYKSVEKAYNRNMKYDYYEIGKKKKVIESKLPLPLKKLQELVGGEIEFFPLKDGRIVCCNEAGILEQLPVNPAIHDEDTEADISSGIRGNLIIGKVRADGEFIGI